MSSNYNQLQNSSMASATQHSDEFVQVRQSNGRYVHKHKGYYAVDDKKVVTSITPVSTVPASLSGATVDFKIDNGIIDVLNNVSLHMYLTNNTGGAVTLVASPLHILRMEVSGNDGAVLATITGDDLYQQYFYLERDCYESQATTIGLSATTYNSTGASIADTASIELNLPIYQFFHSIKLATSLLRSPIQLKFYFQPTSLTHITGTAMTCTSLQLVLRGKRLKEEFKNDLKQIYSPHAPLPLSLPHLRVDRQPLTVALVANQVLQIPLTGMQGVCSYLVFTVRLASNLASPTGQITYIRMQDWDIVDSSNASLIGNYRRGANVQQIDWSNNYKNNAWVQKEFHTMAWSADPQGDFANGTNGGFCLMTSNERLSITCPSTLASASYYIEIKGYMHANLVYEKGQLRIEKD